MKLIVVRHGITDANAKGLTNGQSDDNLTEAGRQQALDLIEKLKPYKIDKIISSPLKRATETALPLAEAVNVPIDIDRRIIEVDFGIFTRRLQTDVEKEMGKSASDMFNDYKYSFPGGETSDQVEARVRAFLTNIKSQEFKEVLVVTHGGIIRWIYYILTGQKTGPQPNASVHEFDVKTDS